MANYTKREERYAEQIRRERREQPLRKKWRAPVGPPPTLARELHGGDKWTWFWCPVCQHHGPLALAPLAILFGMNITTVEVAKRVTCSMCGHRGATMQRPHITGTADNLEGEEFPAHLATVALERWLERKA